jgi:hypothetical protein
VSRDRSQDLQAAGSNRVEPSLKPLDLLATLRAHNVDFVVIGGFSLAAHGYVRATKGVDVVPEPGRPNLARLMSALEALDAQPLAVGDFKPEEVLELSLENLERGGNWVLRTRYGRLDVMQYVQGLRSYEHLRGGAIRPDIEGLDEEVAFAGLDDLIALKRAAGREEDLRDIGELERARGAG